MGLAPGHNGIGTAARSVAAGIGRGTVLGRHVLPWIVSCIVGGALAVSTSPVLSERSGGPIAAASSGPPPPGPAVAAMLTPRPVGGFTLSADVAAGRQTPAYGTYRWPVVGPVLRGFEEPSGPYGSGHRGIDIGAPFGTDIVAPADGVIGFAGWVAGSLYLSIDHPDGVRTTYSWLSAVSVTKGESVVAGQIVGSTGHGHPNVDAPHLHFGARVGQTYIDPMLLLGGASVVGLVHLAPLTGSPFFPAHRLSVGRRRRSPFVTGSS